MGKGVLVNGEEVDDEEGFLFCKLPLITDAASPRTGLESGRGQDGERDMNVQICGPVRKL